MEGKKPQTLLNIPEGEKKEAEKPRYTIQQLEELKLVARENAFNSMPKVKGCDCPTCNGQMGLPA